MASRVFSSLTNCMKFEVQFEVSGNLTVSHSGSASPLPCLGTRAFNPADPGDRALKLNLKVYILGALL